MDQEKILILSERVKLLFSFCSDLIDDKEIIKKAYSEASDKHSNTLAAAPILTALNMDYEEIELEHRIRAERADALYNLLDVLDRTEKERSSFKESNERKSVEREKIRKVIGA